MRWRSIYIIYTYLIPLWRRRSLGSIYTHIYTAAPEKCLYTLLWRRRSIYILRNPLPYKGETKEITNIALNGLFE